MGNCAGKLHSSYEHVEPSFPACSMMLRTSSVQAIPSNTIKCAMPQNLAHFVLLRLFPRSCEDDQLTDKNSMFTIARTARSSPALDSFAGHARLAAISFARFWKYSSERCRPSRNGTLGDHPSRSRAFVMSGLRRAGSSIGSGS